MFLCDVTDARRFVLALRAAAGLRRDVRLDDVGYPLRGAPVSIKGLMATHSLIRRFVIEQSFGLVHDLQRIQTDEQRGAGFDAFWPFSRVSEHEDRLAKRGSLFLHSA